MNSLTLLTLGGLLGGGFLLTLFVSLFFRRVVNTNEVHIVQSSKKTTSYGKDTGHGNSYYEWPSWLPLIGITKVVLPTSNFTLRLDNYEAYDKGRLPFVIDIAAFFRIKDSDVAAQRVVDFRELNLQLQSIVQGAVRTILASNEIEQIMQGRSTFGEQFTKEVGSQLTNWGVETVKNMELMDIRDHKDSNVIRNIMEKKKSHIEMESRTEVAKNKQAAQVAEINADQAVQIQKQQSLQLVGLRTTEANKQVAIAQQTAQQEVKELEKLTKDKEMSVKQVEFVRTAEIEKSVNVVKAQQYKETQTITAEAQKDAAILGAEGKLEAKKREATGISLEGTAKADAEKAMQLAPVEAQIVLAKEIGSNESYQKYLITIKQVEAQQAVGIEQAKALLNADVKIISNTGDPVSGVNSVRDLFSSKGGTNLGAMLEGLANTETGGALLTKLGLHATGLEKIGGKAKIPLTNGALNGSSNGKLV